MGKHSMTERSNQERPQDAGQRQPIECAEAREMNEEKIQEVMKAMDAFFDAASVACKTPSVATAKIACETSRAAFLGLYPFRHLFLADYRDSIGDFVQFLDESVDSVRDFLHENKGKLDKADREDVEHYADNMKERVRLLTELLVSEARIRRRLFETTATLRSV